MGWNYQREEKSGFSTKIPEGFYRVRIKAAEKAVSKSGNDMLTLQLTVSGYAETVYYYLTFLTNNPAFTNQKLTELYDSFKDIKEGEFDLSKWIGKVGACAIEHDEYNGNTKAKVKFFISVDKQDNLPAWVEVDGMNDGGGNTTNVPVDKDGFMNIPEGFGDEVPFS